jgi:hypothetical protein
MVQPAGHQQGADLLVWLQILDDDEKEYVVTRLLIGTRPSDYRGSSC